MSEYTPEPADLAAEAEHFADLLETSDRMLSEAHATIRRVTELVDDWEQFLPVFGPVDGTGRPDPDGDFMVDMSKEGLIAELRLALSGEKSDRPSKRPRSRP